MRLIWTLALAWLENESSSLVKTLQKVSFSISVDILFNTCLFFRTLAHGLEVERLRIPNFYHYYHSKKRMWVSPNIPSIHLSEKFKKYWRTVIFLRKFYVIKSYLQVIILQNSITASLNVSSVSRIEPLISGTKLWA